METKCEHTKTPKAAQKGGKKRLKELMKEFHAKEARHSFRKRVRKPRTIASKIEVAK